MNSGAQASDGPAVALPPWAERVVGPARRWFAELSRPARILAASTLAAALLLGGGLLWHARTESWGVLFSQLERDDAAALVNKLKELKVPYRLRGEGAIEVPEARVHELRLELASAGLPRGGGVGFEAFDRMRLGATEFEQRVQYRRALEGELARSVGSLGAVQSARVHLVMPERSVFVSRSDPASASVVVRLRPGQRLGAPEVAGVVHLVASSVPSLTAERVALVTTEGVMLHRPRAPGEDPAQSLEEDQGRRHRALEDDLEARTRAMLERVVGEGRADVRVSVELDLARVEHSEDHYDRARTALRSEEQTLERVAPAAGISLAGVPGAESNLPGGATPSATPGAGTPGLVRESHTRNFEVDHVSERRVATQGTLKRVTVAVVVDGVDGPHGVVPRGADELQRLTALVRGAVGASDARGDVVTVESIPFQETLSAPRPEAHPAPRSVAHRASPRATVAVAALVAVALAGAAVASLRRRRRRGLETATVVSLHAPAAPAAELPAEPSFESLRAEAHARAAQDPATAALVLRYWLGAEDTDRNTQQSAA